MFDTLADRFDGIFTKLRSRGKLTDKEIDEVCREMRVALLEADVNVVVARNFIRRVKERAQGAEVAKSLSPAQQVIKIVNEELVETLGGTTGKLTTASKPPTVVMMAGLQGSGKTTAVGEARPPAQEPGPPAAARRRRPPAPRRGRAAARARRAHRRAGLLASRPIRSRSRAARSKKPRGSVATS